RVEKIEAPPRGSKSRTISSARRFNRSHSSRPAKFSITRNPSRSYEASCWGDSSGIDPRLEGEHAKKPARNRPLQQAAAEDDDDGVEFGAQHEQAGERRYAESGRAPHAGLGHSHSRRREHSHHRRGNAGQESLDVEIGPEAINRGAGDYCHDEGRQKRRDRG